MKYRELAAPLFDRAGFVACLFLHRLAGRGAVMARINSFLGGQVRDVL
jgi:hypothetical protein